MKTRPTIFISGVSHEFGAFRDAVEDEIEKKGVFAENQPNFHPDYRTVEEMLRRRLHDSDAVIHIVGFRFGAEPNQRPANAPLRSYTQMEFDIARELQKPVYIFLSTDPSVRQPPKPDEQPEDAEATALQLVHREAVQKTNHLYYFFKDQAELCKLVAEIPPVQAAGFKANLAHFDVLKYAPTELIGRESETSVINDAWMKVRRAESPRPHILTFVALGGEGKTSLVAKWAADLAHQDWPGCDAVFAWSFYSQGTREQNAASSDLFLAEALSFFGDAALAGSAAGAFDKGRRLAGLVGERRALLILDGLEPLQYAPTSPTPGELKDQGLAALLKGLASSSHGLCVVTTRYAIPDLRAFIGKTVREEKLTRLATEAGVALLQSLGVNGSLRKTIPSADGRAFWNEYEKLVEDVQGHALTLNLLGSYLRDAHAGDIRQRDLIKLAEADAEEQGGHAFRVMDAYVQSFASGGKTAEDQAKGERALTLLQLLGLFDRPATADCLKALWQPPAIAGLTEPLIGISEAQRNLSLKRLEDAKLLTVNRAGGSGELIVLDAHPLLREYFAQRLRQQQQEAWRAAHQRLYEHLCATTKEGDQPTLEDLQPLYRAVAHGCQAGLQQEAYGSVFLERINRGDNRYSWRVLGAFGEDLGAVACFFDRAWDTVSPRLEKTSQIHLLRSAAFRLFATGRQFEALVPAEKGAQIARQLEFWSEASSNFVSLAQIKLTLGDIAGSIKDAKAAVECADHDGVILNQMNRRAVFADVLHQAGEYGRAKGYFADADEIALHHMQLKVLGGSSGFRYSNLLLGETERAAWQTWIGAVGSKRADPAAAPRSTNKVAILGRTFYDVERRASQSLDWFLNRDWHIDIALSHLTLGCIWLYCTILDLRPEDSFVLIRSSVKGKKASHGLKLSSAHAHIDSAVDRLRRAGQQQFLPLGLLTRAWFRFLSGVTTGSDSAQSDLDEAWEIAERGSMKLLLADIHLYRARLFFRAPSYPWQSPQDDLAAAAKLINECGYHRRDAELADAQQAILGQAK